MFILLSGGRALRDLDGAGEDEGAVTACGTHRSDSGGPKAMAFCFAMQSRRQPAAENGK
jgi:hypothetical protein